MSRHRAPHSSNKRRHLGRGGDGGLKTGGHLVLTIAASLFSTTVVTATLGFAFWVVAARLTTTEVVGRSAALISAMQFIATFATLGLQTMLIAELHSRDTRGIRRLVVSSLSLAGAVAVAGAVGFAIVHHFAAAGEWIYATPIGVALFAIGAAVTAITIVLDGAVIGVQQSSRQVTRNLVFSAVKLLTLPLAAFTVGLSPEVVFSVWLLGNLVSLVVLALRTNALKHWLRTAPSARGLSPLWRTIAGHHWVNVATQAPRLILPVMVAAQLSDEANAAFYAALLLATFMWIIPDHLATAMFALNSGNPQHFHTGLSTAIRLSAVVSVLAAVGAPIVARPMLGIFGPGYGEASYCLVVLAFCTFASAIKSIYIAVRRAQGALNTAAFAAVLGAILEIGAAEVGLKLGGITGIGIGLGAATLIEAAFFWPAIAKVRRQNVTSQHSNGDERQDPQCRENAEFSGGNHDLARRDAPLSTSRYQRLLEDQL